MEINKIHNTNASLKYMLITIALISIVLLSMPAKAETGTITLTNNSQVSYTSNNPTAYANTPDFAHLSVDATTYTTIYQVVINTTNAGVTLSGNQVQTPFTIVSGGSGSGIAAIDPTHKIMSWYFYQPSTITSSPLVLSYDTNIFTAVSLNDARTWSNPTSPLDQNHPVYLYANGQNVYGTCSPTCGSGENFFGYASLATSVTNTYNITYFNTNQNFFITRINKSKVNTKVIIQNASGTPLQYPTQNDTTFNNNNYSIINTYGQGIALNMSISGGLYNLIVINSTGSTVVTPAPTPQASPYSSVNSISTTKTSYLDTESANIFGSFYPATSTTTSCLFFGFICTDTTISTESNTGYVFISTQGSTSPMKFISFTPDGYHNYNINQLLPVGTYQAQLVGFAGPGTTCTSGTVYDFPFIPLGCYYPHNITTFSVTNNSGHLLINWQTKISNSTAIYGDTISVAWSNTTPNDYVKIYDNMGAITQSYNINQSTINQIPVFIPLYTIGTWNATIYNGSDATKNASAFLNVVPPGSVDVNNSFGITMYWSKASDVINNPTLLNWNTGTYTGYYNISVLQNGNEIRRTSYFGVPGQAQQASYTFGEQGAYVAQFLDYPNQTVQGQADIFISAVSNGGGAGSGGGSGSGGGVSPPSQSGNNLVGASNLIINLPWIGLMLLIIVIFGLVKNGVETGMATFVIAITISIEALIGLWQQWGIYITILSWLLVGVFFKLNRSIEE